MRQILSPDDMRRGDVAEVGWHPAQIIGYNEKDADTDGSTNCIFQFKILDGPSKGIICQKLFNEKALGFGKNLWKTLNFPYDPQKGYDLSTDLFNQTVGHQLSIYTRKGKSNKGNEFTDVTDFRPLAA